MKKTFHRTACVALAWLAGWASLGLAQPPTEYIPAPVADSASPVPVDGNPHAMPCETEIYTDCICTAPGRWVPNMLGDFIGGFYFGPAPEADLRPRAQARSLNRFKVADNNSPIPRSRILTSFNFFDNAFDTNNDIFRGLIGAEWAFFQQRVSAEVKWGLDHFTGSDFTDDQTEITDVRATLKALLFAQENAFISGGVGVGIPVGDYPGELDDDNVMIAPYLGYLFLFADQLLFVQGFQQLDIPTVDEDLFLMHTDVGLGVFMIPYQPERFVSSWSATVEAHVYTPLGKTSGVYNDLNYRDVVNLTVGSSVLLGDRLSLATGVSVPVSSSQDYDLEYQLHLNWIIGPRVYRPGVR